MDVTIENNWICDNGTDGTGDGIYIRFAFPEPAVIRNNTIADNNDYGIRADASTYADITNCIFWGNGSGQLNNCSATYSCIDIDPVSGTGNINSDPFFANAWKTDNDTIDLDGDTYVDINDLQLFCSDWLWVAPWSAQYETMMQSGPSSFSRPTPSLKRPSVRPKST